MSEREPSYNYDGDVDCEWHAGQHRLYCPECEAAAEAAQPDTVKEAEGWA